MSRIKAIVTTYGIVFMLMLVAVIGAFIGYYRGEVQFARAGVFFLVAAVLFLELFAMTSRTAEGTWDGLAASMAFFRASVINYIVSIMIMLAGVGTFQEWWWTFCRIFMGVAASIALFFMAKEDILAWRDLGHNRRLRALATGFGYLALLAALAFFW